MCTRENQMASTTINQEVDIKIQCRQIVMLQRDRQASVNGKEQKDVCRSLINELRESKALDETVHEGLVDNTTFFFTIKSSGLAHLIQFQMCPGVKFR